MAMISAFTTVDKTAHNSRKFTFTLLPTNYGYWKTMIEPFLITNNLTGYVNGSIPCPSKTLSVTDGATVLKENPNYPIWVSNDAHVQYADALAIIGEPVKDKDLVMLAVSELTAQLSALGFQVSHIAPSGPQAFYDVRPSNNNNNRGNRNNSRGNNKTEVVLSKIYSIGINSIGHIPSQCPNRDPSTIHTWPSNNFANTLAQSSNASANWHSDIGANSHVTPDLEAMDNSETYYGDDALHVGNGKGLSILHIGSSKVYSPQKTFSLKNILHVSEISHKLLSIQNFCHDNDVFFEFHTSYFVVKDESTHTTLLIGPSKHGLYTITLPQLKSISKVSFSAVRASPTIWHRRLRHPHQRLLHSMLSIFSLRVTNKSLSSLCNSCPLGKSSKLPLFESVFQSNNILYLVYCDI
ncbi:putative RNA-directed DNA polymerase [Tanacetum coccineum]